MMLCVLALAGIGMAQGCPGHQVDEGCYGCQSTQDDPDGCECVEDECSCDEEDCCEDCHTDDCTCECEEGCDCDDCDEAEEAGECDDGSGHCGGCH